MKESDRAVQVVSLNHTREERGLLGAHDVWWTSALYRPERRPIAGRGGANLYRYGSKGAARGSRVQNREMKSENLGTYNLPPR